MEHNERKLYTHIPHPELRDHKPLNVHKVHREHMTIGQKVADLVASRMGSWSFVISQALIMVVWITLNLVGWFYHWDIYPFVLLNLAMSAQAT